MYFEYPPYVPVHVRRAQANKKIAAMKKRGRKVSPVAIEGRIIAKTFWGKSWCENLEGYSDFANRLPRGRTYVRNGSVVDLQIEEGKVTALVSGSELYTTIVRISPLPQKRWKPLVRECAGQIDSLVELLTGNLSQGVMEVLCRAGSGLVPRANEILLDCSCPDGARLCKHLAAVLYGVGARLDARPELVFVLRGVDKMDLLGAATEGGIGNVSKSGKTLDAAALESVFGIELDQAPERSATAAPRKLAKRRGALRLAAPPTAG